VDSGSTGSDRFAGSEGAAPDAGVAVGGTGIVVAVGDGGSGVGVAGGVGGGGGGGGGGMGVAKMLSGVDVGKRVGVKLAISVGVGEENFTGISVGVGSGIVREFVPIRSARLQAIRKMVKISKAGNRNMHHYPIINPIEKKKP